MSDKKIPNIYRVVLKSGDFGMFVNNKGLDNYKERLVSGIYSIFPRNGSDAIRITLETVERIEEFDSLSESEARNKLKEILDFMYQKHPAYSELNLVGSNGKKGFIEYHIDRMYKEFGGKWDKDRAAEYLVVLGYEVRD